jgi:hypothetical protein
MEEQDNATPDSVTRSLLASASVTDVFDPGDLDSGVSQLESIQPVIPELKAEYEPTSPPDLADIEDQEAQSKVRSDELCSIHAAGLPCSQRENISIGLEHVHLPLCAAHELRQQCNDITDEEHRYNFLHVCPSIRRGDACRDGNFWFFLFFLTSFEFFFSGTKEDFCILIPKLLVSRIAL